MTGRQDDRQDDRQRTLAKYMIDAFGVCPMSQGAENECYKSFFGVFHTYNGNLVQLFLFMHDNILSIIFAYVF